MRNIIDATSLRDPNGPVDPQYYKKLKELLFRDISAVLYSNMDKRFLKNNPSLIEDIEYILMNSVNYTNNQTPVSYTHLTLPTISCRCRSRWSPYH